MPSRFAIVHVEWGRHWSGGTRQVASLLEGLAQRGIGSCLVCQEGSELAERMQGKIALKTFNLRGEHDLLAWWEFARWLSAFKREQKTMEKTLLVHVHSRRGAFPTLLIARLLKLSTILHWRVAAPIRFPIKFADIVIAISEAAARQALKSGYPPEKVIIVRSGIDTGFFEPFDGARKQMRDRLGLEEKEFVVVAVGRLIKGKGQDLLLRSIANLEPSTRPTLLLVGDGDERKQLEKLAVELGVEQKVKFLGFQKDIRSILWAADVFVHSPTTFPEGLSVAILEAMAAGLPVIATPVGGIPEIVRHGETGWLVPPNDATALAEALKCLWSDPLLRQQLGKTAQAHVREHHDINTLVERTSQVYIALLS